MADPSEKGCQRLEFSIFLEKLFMRQTGNFIAFLALSPQTLIEKQPGLRLFILELIHSAIPSVP